VPPVRRAHCFLHLLTMGGAFSNEKAGPAAGMTDLRETTILDGSTGYVLLSKGLPEDDMFQKIWSAYALLEERYHSLVVQTHKAYMEVGATSVTTNSYATQPTYYEKAFGDEFEPLMLQHVELSARLAAQAREEHVTACPGAQIRILGSLPPLVESHRPDMFATALADKGEEFFVHHYGQLALALLKGGVDALLFETLNSWEEARLGLEALRRLKINHVPIIVSFEGSIRDESLKPQPQLAPWLCDQVLQAKAEGALPIEAIGWNCAPPEDIVDNLEAMKSAGALDRLREQGVGVVVYANLHEREVYDHGFDVGAVDATEHSSPLGNPVKTGEAGEAPPPPSNPGSPIRKRADLLGSGNAGFAVRFARDFGACAVGGCCGCGPEGIADIHRHFKVGAVPESPSLFPSIVTGG